MHAARAILEPAARLGHHGEIEHELDPVGAAHHLREGDLPVLPVAVQSRRHRQQVLDREALLPGVAVGDGPAPEEPQHRLRHPAQVVPSDGDADQGGGDALGHRRDVVPQIVLEGPEVGIQHQVAVANDGQAVDRDLPLADQVECFGQHPGVHPLRFGGGAAPG